MHDANTAMLVDSCHTGTPVKPSLSITSTGAEKGKMLRTTQIGLFGYNKITDRSQKGAIAQSVNIEAKVCASRTLLLTAATPIESTANNR